MRTKQRSWWWTCTWLLTMPLPKLATVLCPHLRARHLGGPFFWTLLFRVTALPLNKNRFGGCPQHHFSQHPTNPSHIVSSCSQPIALCLSYVGRCSLVMKSTLSKSTSFGDWRLGDFILRPGSGTVAPKTFFFFNYFFNSKP